LSLTFSLKKRENVTLMKEKETKNTEEVSSEGNV
jgi:hypothetical protein